MKLERFSFKKKVSTIDIINWDPNLERLFVYFVRFSSFDSVMVKMGASSYNGKFPPKGSFYKQILRMVLFWKYFRDDVFFYVGGMHDAIRNGKSSTDGPRGSGLARTSGDFKPTGLASQTGELVPACLARRSGDKAMGCAG